MEQRLLNGNKKNQLVDEVPSAITGEILKRSNDTDDRDETVQIDQVHGFNDEIPSPEKPIKPSAFKLEGMEITQKSYFDFLISRDMPF